MGRIAWISISPVKALSLVSLEEAFLDRAGIADNRRFYLVDDDGRKTNAKELGALLAIRQAYDFSAETLALTFPDGRVVEGSVELGDPVSSDFYGMRLVTGRFVLGPWSEAISSFVGKNLRLVRTDDIGDAVDRGEGAAVTLLSRASLEQLADAAGVDTVDERRFRMLIGVDGLQPHEEDVWLDRRVALGEAIVVPRGHVGRCAVTTRNPDTGDVDLKTLHALRSYRPEGTEPLPFGVWGEVVQTGVVRVGDEVAPVETSAAAVSA
ncbi:MAG TPA: MOSC N-terminal beta barrel domain-containing protein [Gaiellaceae bacterium]